MFMNGTRQAGEILGSFSHNFLCNWGLSPSRYDAHLYFFRDQMGFILVAVVVDDLTFSSNRRRLISSFKEKLSARFDVKYFGELLPYWLDNFTWPRIHQSRSNFARETSFGIL